MKLSLLERGLLALCAALVLSLGVAGLRLRAAAARERSIALRGDSLAAALDTSKHVALSARDSARLLGDSLQAVERRAFQVPQKNDALDAALHQSRLALAQLGLQVQALEAKLSSQQPVAVDSTTGARSASFAIDSEPYRGSATAVLPVSGPGSLALHIRLDTARLGLRLGCGPATDGIRAAQATLTGPRWLQLELGRVEQGPELCNPLPARPSLFRRLLSSCGVGGGYAIGRGFAGPALTADCRLWP